MQRSGLPRIAVIGAGPVGIEAALYAKALGFSVVVYERGEVGEHLMRWKHVRLFTPFALNQTPLGVETIRTHARNIYRKLQVESREQLTPHIDT